MGDVLTEVDPDIRLGFADPVFDDEKFLLHATQFPSKVGGSPIWLHPDVPKASALKCKICEETLAFIMQIYAPIDGVDRAYHRSLYLFGCPGCNGNFRCYRTQLPENNEVYPNEAPPDSPRAATAAATEFDKTHSVTGPAVKDVLPELILNVEEEPCSDDESDVGFGDETDSEADDSDDDQDINEAEKKRAEELLRKYEETGGIEMDDDEAEAWEKLQHQSTHKDAKDRIFRQFRRRCTRAPGQVMRYQRNGQPLWFATQGMPANPPAPCGKCGAPRTFEFQVQPQMFAEVESAEDSGFEFAVLVVSTCQQSCHVQDNGDLGAYVEEFVYRQKENAETPV